MKKEDQITRIEGFINSLEHVPMEEGQQALVLQSELILIGGNNGQCSNYYSTSCGNKNRVCVNKGSTCSGKNTKTCTNGEAGRPGHN